MNGPHVILWEYRRQESTTEILQIYSSTEHLAATTPPRMNASFSVGNATTQLTITDVEKNDTGSYTCRDIEGDNKFTAELAMLTGNATAAAAVGKCTDEESTNMPTGGIVCQVCYVYKTLQYDTCESIDNCKRSSTLSGPTVNDTNKRCLSYTFINAKNATVCPICFGRMGIFTSQTGSTSTTTISTAHTVVSQSGQLGSIGSSGSTADYWYLFVIVGIAVIVLCCLTAGAMRFAWKSYSVSRTYYESVELMRSRDGSRSLIDTISGDNINLRSVDVVSVSTETETGNVIVEQITPNADGSSEYATSAAPVYAELAASNRGLAAEPAAAAARRHHDMMAAAVYADIDHTVRSFASQRGREKPFNMM